MEECEYCEEEFDDETELHLHWGEEHEDELSSHDEEKVKKAEREKEKQAQRKKAKMKEYRNYAILGVILVGLVGAGAMVAPGILETLSGGDGNIGAAGSAHAHADFSVVVNGEEIDFSQPQYQVVSQKAHVEGGDGDIVHAHATGATFGFFMRSLGFDYGADFLKTPESRYEEEEGNEVRMFVDTSGEWREIDPSDFEFESGDRILLTYGNYTEEEISDFQGRVTSRSGNL